MSLKNSVKIIASKARGIYYPPPSKSIALRMILLLALADGAGTLYPIENSQDNLTMLKIIQDLGSLVKYRDSKIQIQGLGGIENFIKKLKDSGKREVVLDCGQSASCLRFLIPLAWLTDRPFVFKGHRSLFNRPMDVYKEFARQNNFIWLENKNSIESRGLLQAGSYRIRGDLSSQFISGFLFALALLEKDSILQVEGRPVSRPYIDLSLACLKEVGIEIEERDHEFFIAGGQKLKSYDFFIEGDYSNAAFFLALSYLGHKLQIKGLNPSSLQGDSVIIEHLQSLSRKNTRISLRDCPDLGPILFVFASLKHGGIFTDCNRLMDKESDRILAMQEEMAKLGLRLEKGYDYVKVFPGRPKKTDIILSTHDDHRIAMALAILLTESGGLIQGIDSVKKSYPNFFTDLKSLGVNIDIYD